MSAIDLTNLTYYFWSRTSPALIWVELPRIDLRAGTPVRAFDPDRSGPGRGRVREPPARRAQLLSGARPGATAPVDGRLPGRAEERLTGRCGIAIHAPTMSSATTNAQ